MNSVNFLNIKLFCGENSTQVTSYGFDQQTSCPETKCSLVRIEKA